MIKWLSISVGLFAFICSIQLIYWPILSEPEPISWWQFYPLVELGTYLGFPILVLGLSLPIEDFYLLWVVSILWAIFISFIIYKVLNILVKINDI